MQTVMVNAKANRQRSVGANRDMERDIGISRDATGSQNIYSAIVITTPGGKTDVHHHAECETAIYILKGRARYRFGDQLEHVTTAGEGDFVYIPAHAIHTEENLSETEELRVLVTRNCAGPKTIVVNG
ncbi:MAG: cupin domain-containing protein [Chloroflexota bacterium]